MEMLEAALALLCALGVGSLLWLLFGLLVRPARGREPWVVLPGRGPGEDLEAGLRQLALRLALRWPWVICCPPGELEEWLREAVRQTDGVPQ